MLRTLQNKIAMTFLNDKVEFDSDNPPFELIFSFRNAVTNSGSTSSYESKLKTIL